MKIKKLFISWLSFLFIIQYTGCSSFFYYPDKKIHYPPEEYNVIYRDFTVKSADRTNLHVRWFPANENNKKGYIVQFHGNAENLSSHYTSLIWLRNYGYDLITFDYRGYGKSEGKPEPIGIRNDAISVINFVLKLVGSERKNIILYGQSIGGIILLDALLQFRENQEINAIVLESTFDSYKDIAIEKLTDRWYTWFLIPLAFVIVSDVTSPQGKISKLLPKTPKLIIHGNMDKVIPEKYGRALYNEIGEPKQFVLIDGGEHLNTYYVKNGYYQKVLLNFLNQITINYKH
ncbi:MAG: alpha/beta hydrolase [Spirochaetia bacterium]|nr:alpha/beta hydrolase [Spirochaetia bacterium]